MQPTIAPEKSSSESHGKHNKITLLLILGLLFLRLPLLAGITFITQTRFDWLLSTFEITTYLLTATLIWWERDRLAEFHIDKLAVAIIILFKPIETVLLSGSNVGLAFPSLPSLIVWAIAIGLFVVLRLSRLKFPKIHAQASRRMTTSAGVGIACAVLLAYPVSFQINKGDLTSVSPLFLLPYVVVKSALFQLGYAAVTEEPLFRGFLWGYLRKVGWQEVWIWLFQAGLFWLGHIYYFGRLPVSFWIVVPVSALVFGLLVWRSHSLTSSMMAHTFVNATMGAVAEQIAFSRS